MAGSRARGAAQDPVRKPSVTLDALVDTALRVVESEGLDALSMRRLADQFGVQAASLYWHVANKEQVLDLLADKLLAMALGEALPPAPTGADGEETAWTEQLRQVALSYREFLLRHRDAARIIAGRLVVGVNLAKLLEPILAVLRAGGLDPHDAAYAVYGIIVYVQGFVLHESSPLSALTTQGVGRADALRDARSAISALPVDEFPYVAESADALTEPNLQERFLFGLDRLIEGMDAYAARTNPTRDEDRS